MKCGARGHCIFQPSQGDIRFQRSLAPRLRIDYACRTVSLGCSMTSLNKRFPRLLPDPIRKGIKVSDLIDTSFKAYNGGRLAEACRLFTQKMIAGKGIVGMSLTGALTPAGLGRAAIVP